MQFWQLVYVPESTNNHVQESDGNGVGEAMPIYDL